MGNKRKRETKSSRKCQSKRAARVRWEATKRNSSFPIQNLTKLDPAVSHEPMDAVPNEEQTQNILAVVEKKTIKEVDCNKPQLRICGKSLQTNGNESFIGSEDNATDSFSGKRIINLMHFWEQLQKFSDHGPLNCTSIYTDIIEEHRKGLQSTFTLKCRNCGLLTTISTDDQTTTDFHLDINSQAVLGAVSIGCGFSQLDEFLVTMDIPPLSQRLYSSQHEKVSEIINSTALETMREAAEEEAEMAKQLGHVNENGIPMITVIVDASWCTRSYHRIFNSNSGAACIIGEQTGKLLFLGVRNKYCCICESAKTHHVVAKKHVCFKNWDATASAMEADIIVEGFVNSVEMHNLIYNRVVGDGDSSVTKKLLEVKPYGALLVEKIECCNHLLRNYCNKLRDLAKNTRCGNKLVPRILRQKLETSILRLRTAVTKAAEKRRNEHNTWDEKIVLLTKDLINGPSHVFGEHEKCAEINYFCNAPKDHEDNLVPKMKECGLYQEILKYLYRLVQHSSSLLLNMTNNAAEQYNSIIAKFTGGKRINFAKKRSYQTRCQAAVISFNSKENYLNKIYRFATGRCPTFYMRKYIHKKLLKRLRESKRRHVLKKKSKKKKIETVDEHYGKVDSIPEDMPEQIFLEKKNEFLVSLKKSNDEIILLEKMTRGQSANHLWKQERIHRITASNFGQICKLRLKTSCVCTVKNLLYNTFGGNEATKYGLENEPTALSTFEARTGLTIKKCGLFVGRNEECFLGASPDGIVEEENATLEIKCPKKIAHLSPQEGARSKLLDCLIYDASKKEIKLKCNHNYMFQVQGQLHLTGMKKCYFVVWTPLGIHIEEIEKDDYFWETKMFPKLKQFYMLCLLPEIIDPRHKRNAPIRNPNRNLIITEEMK